MTQGREPQKFDVPKKEHEYDGIIELDNQLPRWWLWKFYLTVLFGVLYLFYYQMGPGKGLAEEFDLDQNKEFIAKGGFAKKAGPSESALAAIVSEVDRKSRGKKVYDLRCASCHGDQGQGQIGPNLTDSYWIHGAKLTEIHHVIENGVLDKGMPPWGSILKEEEKGDVLAYVVSIYQTNPPGAKPPQGEKVERTQ